MRSDRTLVNTINKTAIRVFPENEVRGGLRNQIFGLTMASDSPSPTSTPTDSTPTPTHKWVDFMNELVSSCTKSITISNQLPINADYAFYDAFPAFRVQIGEVRASILTALSRLSVTIDKDNAFGVADTDSLRFRSLVEATDMALERVDTILDATIKKPEASVVVVNDHQQTVAKLARNSLQNRTQMQFRDAVDNSHTPWRPTLTYPLPNHHTSVCIYFDWRREVTMM